MTVQTSHTLKHQVNRREVGNHYVKVQVKRLFDDLRTHHNEAVRARRILPVSFAVVRLLAEL